MLSAMHHIAPRTRVALTLVGADCEKFNDTSKSNRERGQLRGAGVGRRRDEEVLTMMLSMCACKCALVLA
eukprot:2730493-Pleurochrysis_carterae.AAC.2